MRADDRRVGLASEAYIFGYPLVCAVRQTLRLTVDGVGPVRPAGFNTFAHQTEPPGPLSSLLTVNPDVLSSFAQIDLGPGPAVLRLPAAPGRYHVVALYDMWLNVFAYLGSRATGDQGGDFLLVPPGYTTAGTSVHLQAASGSTPPAAPTQIVEAPSRVVTAIARYSFHGPDDLAAVTSLRDALAVHTVDPDARHSEGPPDRSKQVCDDLRFWEEFRTWMRAFPPARHEQDHARRFESLGLLSDPSPYIDPEPRLAWSLRSGLHSGRDELERLAAAGRRACRGWEGMLHGADYNVDRFGPGVLDDPGWEIADRAQARIARAMAARHPLEIIHAYEATSLTCAVDGDGHRLSGAHGYLLRLAPPPVDAFWSLALYDHPGGYLVDNPARRYSIDSRDNPARDADGTIPIVLQFDPPASGSDANATGTNGAENWLPSPPGDFQLTLRMYQPGRDVLDGTYVPAAVQRLC